MRDVFIKTLIKNVKKNDKTILITADLGFGVLNEFRKKFPKKFLNVGVSEQNMIGVATGLSKKGFNVFCYSLGNFPTLRCLEHIRNDASYHNSNIKIINVGGGYSYGPLGFSHHATEDLSIMRSIPNISVIAPSSNNETEILTKFIFKRKGLFYFRLDKKRNELFKVKKNKIKFGKITKIKNGKDIAIISTGGIVNEAYKASEILNNYGVKCAVFSCHTIKPFDNYIIKILKNYKKIYVVEENSEIGGLNGLISEISMKNSIKLETYKNFGINDAFVKTVGDREYLLSKNGLTANQIVKQIRKIK